MGAIQKAASSVVQSGLGIAAAAKHLEQQDEELKLKKEEKAEAAAEKAAQDKEDFQLAKSQGLEAAAQMKELQADKLRGMSKTQKGPKKKLTEMEAARLSDESLADRIQAKQAMIKRSELRMSRVGGNE